MDAEQDRDLGVLRELRDRLVSAQDKIAEQLAERQQPQAVTTFRLRSRWLILVILLAIMAMLIGLWKPISAHRRVSAMLAWMVAAAAVIVVVLPGRPDHSMLQAAPPPPPSSPRTLTPTPLVTGPHPSLAPAITQSRAMPVLIALPNATQQDLPELPLPTQPQPPAQSPPSSAPADPTSPQQPPQQPPSSTPPSQPVCLEVLPGVHVQLGTCLSGVVGLLDATTKGQ